MADPFFSKYIWIEPLVLYIVWSRMENYTEPRIITEYIYTKGREKGVEVRAFNVLPQTKLKNILFTTDDIDLDCVLLVASNSHSNVNKKFRENKIPIHKSEIKLVTLFRVTSSELRPLCNMYGLIIQALIRSLHEN